MAVIKSGNSTDQLIIDQISKAARVTMYNTDGSVSGTTTDGYIIATQGSVTGGPVAIKSDLIGGQYNTLLPNLINTQQSAIQLDSNGRLIISPLTTISIESVQLEDGYGNKITSQLNGLQRALDIGINVSGIQIDPRQIRTLTSFDTITANIGITNGLSLDATLTSGTQITQVSNFPAIQNVSIVSSLPSGLNTIGYVDAYQSGSWTVSVNNFPANQTVNGTVTVNQGTSPWIIDGSGFTQPISGSVSVSNFPSIQAVSQSGTWTVQPGNIANTTPWLTTINQGGNSASVTVSNALKVDGSAVTQPVSGTGNFTVIQSSASNLLNTAWLNDGYGRKLTAQQNGAQTALDVGIVVSGIQIDTRQIRALTTADQISAQQLGAWNVGLNSGLNTIGFVELLDGYGNKLNSNAGNLYVDAYQSGAPWSMVGIGSAGIPSGGVISIQGVIGGQAVPISGSITATNASIGANNTIIPSSSTLIGGSDGINLRPIKTGTDGTLLIDAYQSVAGNLLTSAWLSDGYGNQIRSSNGALSVILAQESIEVGTVDQGNSNTNINGWFIRVTDGVNNAAIKPANTVTSTIDPSFVVALSPNSPLPFGLNTIGYVDAYQSGSWSVGINNFPVNQTVTQTTPWFVELEDGYGRKITAQQSGAQTALDVGINVSGIQIDPRQIRALTSADVVTANAGSGNFTVVQATASNLNATIAPLTTTSTINVELQDGYGNKINSSGGALQVILATESIEIGKVDQGTPNTIGNAWTVQPTDGINLQGFTVNSEAKVSLQTAGTAYDARQIRALTSTDTTTSVQSIAANLLNTAWLNDGYGHKITAQQNGTQTALDIGVNVGGIQIDPRSIRALTSSDVVSAVQSGTWTNTVTQATGTNLHTVVDSGSINVSNFPATTAVTQSTSPWVVSGTVTSNIGTTNGLALDATLTNGTQKTKLVDGYNTEVTLRPGSNIGSQNSNIPIAGTDGSFARTILTDSSGRIIIGSIVGALPAGGNVIGAVTQSAGPWTSNQIQVGGSAITLGQKTSANSYPVVIASDQSSITVSQTTASNLNATIAPLTNSSIVKAQLQDNAGTAINSTSNALNTFITNASLSVTQGTSPWVVSTNPLNTSSTVLTDGYGFATTAAPSYSNNTWNALSLTTTGALRVDNSANTQPVSGTITANAGTGNFTVVQGTGTNLHTVVDSGSITVTQPTAANLNATVVGSGNFTVVQATGSNLHTVVDSGTITSNIGTTGGLALDTTLTGGNTKVQLIDGYLSQVPVRNGSNFGAQNATLIVSGSDGNNVRVLKTASDGTLRIDPTGTTTQPVSGTITANAGTGNFTVVQSTASNLNATIAPLTNSSVVKAQLQDNAGTAINSTSNALNTFITNSTLAVTQSGTWTVQQGTPPWSVTATNAFALDATLTNGTQKTKLVDGYNTEVTLRPGSHFDGQNSTIPISGTDGSFARTILTDVNGRLIINITDGTTTATVKAASTAPQATDTALVTVIRPATTATLTNVAGSVSSVTILASNTNRLQAIFVNDSTSIAYLKFGSTASSSSYTYRMAPLSTVELPQPIYNGIITAIWVTATGNMRATEVTY